MQLGAITAASARRALRRGVSATLIFLAGCLSTLACPAQKQELHVAAAADLQPVFPALAAAYQRAAGVTLIASFGSSATLTQQLLNGAPEDVFLSADFAHPQQLAAAGLAAGPPTPYARGVLVLWARTDSPAQPLAATSQQQSPQEPHPGARSAHALDALLRPTVTRLAIANPDHAPYGHAAQSALAALNLSGAVAPKLVLGENVGQAAQFALTGNAQAALISLTLANSAPFRAAGSYVRVPPVYEELRQSGIVLKRSTNLVAAQAFLHWLAEPETQRRLTQLGLDPIH